jgi:uncharacterized protein YndB with AHSA1/START domain
VKATFVILALTLAGIARADVADSANNGFTAKIVLTIQASPDEVYRRLVGNIGDWWNSAHTFTGDAHNLTIEAKPMGCFCEKLPGGGARHMEVVNFVPGKTLVMVGGLGPLQSLAVAASMTIQLAPADGATKLTVTYAVGGYVPGGLNSYAVPVDGVLTQQFTRLKSYVEHGDPAPKK